MSVAKRPETNRDGASPVVTESPLRMPHGSNNEALKLVGAGGNPRG